ncbi:alpha-ketoacid dehydrogenase subunit alpha/beta [Edaphobacter modestus]|uniref:2-oxoisovalerate dehydrogenase E1 component n=1 Tax=Edaphobacter modestus TaxID=388466 RepID=A0A4Q7XZ61_9BACT|nr:alpha-ketoacid dehydrogenase subunit alpha/beta [Edaphobacter modestus]RZU29712.1 2-oxoisovalerate dehydrogenase E1 component [Edaphobacter modestus]
MIAPPDVYPTIEDSNSSAHITLLREMILIRELEQRSLDLSTASPPTVVGSVHLCAGQEAVPVGTLAGLGTADQIVATYRGHGWALSSGLSLVELMGEICHRTIGINQGRGGSAYMMAPERRFIGENSIVGAGLPIACGVALSNLAYKNGRVVAVSLGDGAFNQGATHEGIAFAAAKNLPVLIICENNRWSELTPSSLTFKVDRIAQRANGYGIQGVTIDGTDPVVVRDTVIQAAGWARENRGPVLIECRVPRLWGHYNRDIEHYRPKEDRDEARARDPIVQFSNKLLGAGLISQNTLTELSIGVKNEMDEAVAIVLNSPIPDPASAARHVWALPNPTSVPDRAPELKQSYGSKTASYIQAVNEALSRELETRPEVVIFGEDVGFAGGIFGASRGLQKRYGIERVFDTPISESAILGSAVGAAMMGMKPIVEIMWADFLLVALDQIINQAANVRYITGGRAGAPIVVRTQQGATLGSCAQHSQCLEAVLAHIPGLRIAIPATPQDAYDLLRSAVASPDPCIIFESRALYQTTSMVSFSDEIEPIGISRLRKSGRDVMIITWGTMLSVALGAAERLVEEGVDAGVLDLRWLCPLDTKALRIAVEEANGKAVVVHEANRTGGFGAEIVATLHELFDNNIHLDVVRVATPDVRIPAAPNLQRELIPTIDDVVRVVRQLLVSTQSRV